MEVASTRDQPPDENQRIRAGTIAALLASALPLIGLVSLLLRSQLDPHFENYRLHFLLFGIVGTVAFVLGFAAGEAANRRGDARVLLLSLAFMATGGFMGLHALGTRGVLFTGDHSGFKVAIPIGLLVSAGFAAASAFADLRPGFASLAIRHRRVLRASVLLAMAGWFVWTVANLPPLDGPNSEAARGTLLTVLAIVGTIVYAASAARYWTIFRARPTLLPAAVIACFVLLSEALIGVAVTGERKWHASWWEWHFLIVTAYLIIGFAARREWREERFRDLYLATTRERRQDVSVLFSDLVGYTSFAERTTPAGSAAVLQAYWGTAAPLLTRRFGARWRSSSATAWSPSSTAAATSPITPGGPPAPRWRCSAPSPISPTCIRTGRGCESASTAARPSSARSAARVTSRTRWSGTRSTPAPRLEGLAPVGGVLIGAETYERLPDGAVVEPRAGLRVKGKDVAVDAHVLHALPC